MTKPEITMVVVFERSNTEAPHAFIRFFFLVVENHKILFGGCLEAMLRRMCTSGTET